tara:strand:+ start:45 stop:677 length:633 start_codon:yes stop_codon:yes gene_type:complete
MKKLLTEWRKFVLTEGMKTAADLPEGSGIAIDNEKGGSPTFVYTYKGESLILKHRFSERGIPEDTPWGEVVTQKLSRNCLNGHMVMSSGTKTGWGPLLYDVAMEWATAQGGGLTSDRGSVSRDAYRVWDYYLRNRPDVEAAELDIINRGYEKITPDDESDDCEQIVSISWARKNNSHKDFGWSAEPTAYLYRVSGTPTMDALRAAGKLEE